MRSFVIASFDKEDFDSAAIANMRFQTLYDRFAEFYAEAFDAMCTVAKTTRCVSCKKAKRVIEMIGVYDPRPDLPRIFETEVTSRCVRCMYPVIRKWKHFASAKKNDRLIRSVVDDTRLTSVSSIIAGYM